MQDIFSFLQHHLGLSLALAFVLILLIVLEFLKQKKSANALTPAQAVQLINHQNAVVVDIRPTDAYAAGHIIDAVSAPLKELEEKQNKIEKFKSQPLILVCAMGVESQRAYTLLQLKGFNVHVLGGGLRAWREASMPVTK